MSGLLEPSSVDALALGPLWRILEQLQFIRENVDPELLEEDFVAAPSSRAIWSAFERREKQVWAALRRAAETIGAALRSGALTPEAFRAGWTQLGFATHADGSGTPADDYLDGLFEMVRLTLGDARPVLGNLNVASRAYRIADLLAITEPQARDVVFDLGSGSGKVALTVAASTRADVRGIELGDTYVEASRLVAERLGLSNVRFIHADVRDVDLSEGTIFFLYFPFRGAVAQTIAETLAALAARRAITIYSAGPEDGFGEHFLTQVARGALVLSERRGEFAEAMVLRSP